MGGYLTEKNDLGLDSEILAASAVDLVKRGVATGRHKADRPGVATASFIVPGADFAFCDDNPQIELHAIEWCKTRPRIAGIANLVTINQAAMIDLTGQVASESIGPAMYTGPGGQLCGRWGRCTRRGAVPSTSCRRRPATARCRASWHT